MYGFWIGENDNIEAQPDDFEKLIPDNFLGDFDDLREERHKQNIDI